MVIRNNAQASSTDVATNAAAIDALITSVYVNQDILANRKTQIVCVGDSITDRANSYVTALQNMYGYYLFRARAASGRKLTAMFDLLLEATGLLRWTFRDGLYPWTASGGMSANIVGRKLQLLQPADASTAYISSAVLAQGEEVTITGYYSSANSSRIKIFSDTDANILTGTSTGSFSVVYTPTGANEELRISSVSGSLNDPIDINDFQLQLTDRRYTARHGVVVWGGTNDVWAGDSFDDIFAAMSFCVDQVLESGNVCYIPDILPAGGTGGWTAARELVRLQLNEARNNLRCTPLNSSIIADGDTLRTEYTDDGLHPSVIGYEALGKEFAGGILGGRGVVASNAVELMGAPLDDTDLDLSDQKVNITPEENALLLFNSDLTSDTVWTNQETVTGDYKSIISSVVPGLHRRYQTVTVETGNYVLQCKIKGLKTDWVFVYLFNNGSSKGLFVNTSTLELGTVNAGVNAYEYKKVDTDTILLRIEVAAVAGSSLASFAPAGFSTSPNYSGDGVNPDTEVTDMLLYKGTIDDYVEPASTLGYPVSKRLVSRITTDHASKHERGQVLGITGDWISPADATGLEMFDSKANNDMLLEFGYKKRVDDNTWEYPISGVVYYNGNKHGANTIYYVEVAGSLAAASTNAVTGLTIAKTLSIGGYGTSDDGLTLYQMGTDDLKVQVTLSTGTVIVLAGADLYGSSNPYLLTLTYI